MKSIQVVLLALAMVMLPGMSQQCSFPYTVKSGDYCWAIMNTYGVSSQTFYSLNPGLDCNNLKVGQVLCLQGYVAPPTLY